MTENSATANVSSPQQAPDPLRFAGLRKFALWGTRVFTGMLVLITVYLCAGRLLMPLLAGQQALVEAQLARLLGVPVTILGLDGRWTGFTPQLTIGSLVIQADNSEPQQIQGLTFSIDVLASLRKRQLAVGGIRVEALKLVIEQTPQGRWTLVGLAPGQVDYSAQIVDAVLQIPNLELRESSFVIRPLDLPEISLNSVFLLIQNEADTHQLQLQFRVLDQASPSQILVNLDGNPDTAYAGQAWLSVPGLDVQPMLENLIPEWQVSQAAFTAALWLQFDSEGMLKINGNTRDISLLANHTADSRQSSLTNAGFDLQAEIGTLGDWRMQLSKIALDWQNQPWELPAVLVRRPDGESVLLDVSVPGVDLGMISAIGVDLLPPGAGHDALRTVNPRGEFANLKLATALDGSYPGLFSLRGNLRNISVDPWNAAPGGTGLDAYLELDTNSGFAEVDSRDMTLELPLLFSSTWFYDHVNSRLGWNVGEGRVHVYSTLIEVDSRDLQGRLAFNVLNTRDAENNLETAFKLKVGVESMELLPGKVYLPSVPQVANLMDWLTESLQGGQLQDSAFMFRSNARNGREISSMAASWYQAEAGRLQFLPDWPALEAISAAVVVRDNYVDVISKAGSIAGIPLTSAIARVRPAAQGSLVTVTADASTDTATGLQFLIDSPLRDSLGSTFDSWQPGGQLDIDLQLQIPVGDNPLSQQIAVQVQSIASTLMIPEYALKFSDVKGQVTYTTDEGLQARELTATLFDFPIVASIDSQLTEQGTLTRVSGQGHARIAALRDWSRQPVFVSRLLAYTSGEIDYNLQLDFPGMVKADGTSTVLQLDSSLQEVVSELPAPFNKAAGQSKSLSLQYAFSESGNADLLSLRFDDQFTGQLVLDQRGLNRGQLDFGDRNRSFNVRQSDSNTEGLLVSGNLAELDYDAWEPVAQSLVSGDEDARSLKEALRLVDVSVQDLIVRGEHFSDIGVQVQPEPEAWLISANNTMLQGMLRVPDNDDPWGINLQYLRFPAVPERTPEEAAVAAQQDLLEAVDPGTLPAIDFRTAELKLGDSDLGELRFELRPTEFGAEIRRFWMFDADSRISDAQDTTGANIHWDYRNGFHSSRFSGVFAAGDLAKVMPDWGHDVFMTSKTARFEGSLGWPGSPLAFNVKSSSGQLVMNIQEGRFVDIDSGSSRIFGALNFDALIRRLQLDFSDLFQRGLAYDRITADLALNNGVITTNDSLVIDGPSSRLRINGEINLPEETIAADMLVRIPLGQNISMLAGLLGAWPIAVSTYVASKIFAEQVGEFTSLVYRLEGPWASVEAGFEAPTSEEEVSVETTPR